MRSALLLMMLLLLGCSGDPGTGPTHVHWDRDACDRCRMAISDPKHSAQIRGGLPGQPSQVFRFDDIGCAVLWLEQQPWKDAPNVEIWTTDHRDGRWIDARRAFYLTGQHTPMEYGLGAQEISAAGAISFEEAIRVIHSIEAAYNLRDGKSLEKTP